MPKTLPEPSDLPGASRLAIEAIVGITTIAEAVHLTILRKTGDEWHAGRTIWNC